jgi:hypothetical protein
VAQDSDKVGAAQWPSRPDGSIEIRLLCSARLVSSPEVMMASATADRIRFTWFASTAGTAASYFVFRFLTQMLAPPTGLSRLVLLVFSATIGGAAAAYVSPSSRSIPCLIVGLLMALQFYDPVIGPSSARPLSVYLATVIAGIIASFFGHTSVSLNASSSDRFSHDLLHRNTVSMVFPNTAASRHTARHIDPRRTSRE